MAWWMYFTWLQTGFWTGTDRGAPRHLPEAVQHWAELTGFGANLLLTARTLLVDFFSPSLYAAHSVVTHPYAPSWVEWAGLGLVAACLAAGGPAWWRLRRAPRGGAFLVAEFLAAYLAVTIVVWTSGNNDPIYTRFLYPAYPLVFILAIQGYRALREEAAWRRVPFKALYVLFVVVHALRSWRGVSLPVRYFGA